MPQPTPLDASLDHVAVAVDDLDAAEAHWHALGATPVMGSRGPYFANEQVRLSNGGKVELIGSGTSSDSFINGYLSRFGSGRIHHITLKLDHGLTESVARLAEAGIQTVDVDTSDPDWHEAFLRPSQVGGLIIQLAVARQSDAEFAASVGRPPPPTPNPGAAALRRVVLGHANPASVQSLWSLLGARVTRTAAGGDFVASFPNSAVDVEVRQAQTTAPIGLAFDGAQQTTGSRHAPAFVQLRPDQALT